MQVLRNRRYRILLLNGGGAPAAAGGVYDVTVATEGTSYGDQDGSSIVPDPSFTDASPTWARFVVTNTNLIQVRLSDKSRNYFSIRVKIPDFADTWYTVNLTATSIYDIWETPASEAITGLHTWMSGKVGTDVEFQIEFIENTTHVDELGLNEHWLIPEQISASQRGFNASTAVGTYNPGYFSRMEFTNTNTQFPVQFMVSSAGLFTIDCPASPSPTTGFDVTIEGYGTFSVNNWNGFDFRATSKADLYTFFGNNLGIAMKVTMTGP